MVPDVDSNYLDYFIRKYHPKSKAENNNNNNNNDRMLIDDDRSLHSSVGSNNVSVSKSHSQTPPSLVRPADRSRHNTKTNFPWYYLFRRNKGGGFPKLNDDALARALMDANHPVQGPENYEQWTLDFTKLALGESFDEGTFGKIFRGKYNGEEVAIKILGRPADPVVAQDLERQFKQEVMTLATMSHPNVVRFVGACRKPTVWVIVTVYAKGGSVRKYLENKHKGPMALRLVIKQALDVARGMAYMHGLGLVHRDLKSNNLLIDADRSIKIADFGVARIQGNPETMTSHTGTYRWMSPEMIQNFPYNQKVDVYSFGIVLWELVTGLLPFQEMEGARVPHFVIKGFRPPIPNDCLPVLREIICRCWDSNPDVRPSFAEVVTMLENAQTEIFTTVRKALFRCSFNNQPRRFN